MSKLSSKMDNILSTLGTNNSSQIATAVLAGFKMFFIPAATANDKNATPEQKKYTMARDVITEALALTTYLGVTGQVQKHATAPICKSYYKNKANLIETGKLKPVKDLTKEEIDFLKKVDSKKIEEIGMDFLTQKSSKPKVASEETKQYIQKLNNIIRKINGSTEEVKSVPIDEFLSELSKNSVPKEKKGISVLINDFKNAAKPTKTVIEAPKLFQNTRIALSQVCVWVLALAVIPPLCNAIIAPVMRKINGKKETTVNQNQPIIQTTTTVGNNRCKKGVSNIHSYQANITNSGNMRV